MRNTMPTDKPFITNAAKEEKEAFLTILCTLANLDGGISPEEIKLIEAIAQKMDITLEQRFFNVAPELCFKIARSITTRRLSLELIKYMLALAYTDKNFSDSEGVFIGKMSAVLGIESEKVSEISTWVIDRIIWLEQAVVIFEDYDFDKGENNE